MRNPNAKLPFVSGATTIRELLRTIDDGTMGIALVLDEKERLRDALTDGDVRRAILGGIELDARVDQLLLGRKKSTPVTARIGTSSEELRELMRTQRIRQIPLLDAFDRVIAIALESDYLDATDLSLESLIMAGGFGTRLMPLTRDLPKPMLPINGKPLLEHIVSSLQSAGIKRVNISTHYLADTIVEHFRDGKDFGVDIEYVSEDEPMGTAGALSKYVSGDDPLLVVNGDVLTSVNYRAMLDFHREHNADMTIAVAPYEVQIPYGVVAVDGIDAVSVVEKPKVRNFINAGIYLLQPRISDMVPRERRSDMPELIEKCIQQGKRVICFPIREYWLDVGQIEQYERATVDAADGKV